jgi:DNA-binding transcriptional ArsR family regulator
MARASTKSDAFNAVAEPRRRQILSYLASAERPVGEIVAALGLDQPSVSKHLRVLREVGLVRMRCQSRQKLYRTNAEAIRPLHQWAGTHALNSRIGQSKGGFYKSVRNECQLGMRIREPRNCRY